MVKASLSKGFDSVRPIAATVKQNVQVIGERGLTMLACSRVIEQIGGFTGKVTVSNGRISANGHSILEMLQLAAEVGTVLSVELVGPDADQLMRRIAPVLANGL